MEILGRSNKIAVKILNELDCTSGAGGLLFFTKTGDVTCFISSDVY